MKNNKVETEKVRQVALTYIKEIIDILRECFLVIDSNLKVIAANELFYQTFQVRKEETEGQLIFDLGNRQWDIPELKILFTDIIPKKGVISNYGVVHSFETIGEKIMLLNAKQIETSQFIIVAIEDVTVKKDLEKKLAEYAKTQEVKIQEVEEAKSKAEAILESVGDGVIVTDEQGKIIMMNKATEEMLGRKTLEILGKPFYSILLLEDEKGNSIPLEKLPVSMALLGATTTTTTTTTTTATTYYYLREDKTKFPVSISVAPVILNNKIIGTVNVFRDITKEKEIDLAKSEFVALASHQLRTPLSTINWYTEMLMAGDAGKITPAQMDFLQEVNQGNQRMISLVNALLNVSRIDLGTFAIDPKPIQLTDVVDSVLEEMMPQIAERKTQIVKHYDPNLPLVNADANLIRIVVQNLLTNAVKYTPGKGRVSVSLTMQPTDILLTVQDNGYGIPQKAQSKIFTKLFRADNVQDKETDGIGLGLYVTKAVVEQSGGHIWFVSEENKGATFSVTFPLSGAKPKEGTKGLTT